MVLQDDSDAQSIRIRLLGGFEVSVGSDAVDDSTWRLRKAKSAIKLLALAEGHRIHKEQVLDLLWPELETEAATNNLHKTLYVARRALEPSVSGSGSYIRFQGDTLELTAPNVIWVDAEAFQAAAETARRSGSSDDYRAALALYKGDLLPEDRYEDWAISRREELQALFVSTLQELAQIEQANGNLDLAIEALKTLVSSEPTHEEAHLVLMRLYASSGRRHEAVRQYQRLTQDLERELGVEPDSLSRQLYEDIVGGRIAQDNPIAPATVSTIKVAPVRRKQEIPGPTGAALVGRDDELETVEELLEALRNRSGACLVLSGPAGVGKSRLAHEVAESASQDGAEVLWGGAYEQEQQLPYGPLTEALEDYFRQVPSSDLQSLVRSLPSEIYKLLPSVNIDLGNSNAAPDSPDRQRLFAAVRVLLERIGGDSPVALVMDDIQYADESSLELFHFLARSAKEMGMLLVATFKPEDAGHNPAIGRVLSALNRQKITTTLDLKPLEPAESEILITSILGQSRIEQAVFSQIHNVTEGNPLYTEEVIRTLTANDGIEEVSGRWRLRKQTSMVSDQLAELVGGRLSQLSDTAQRVLNMSTVIGREFTYSVLRAACELSEYELLDGLDEAISNRVAEETLDGYKFVHPVHRAVLYEGFSRARRQLLHSRVASAIENVYSDSVENHAEALGFHYASSSEPIKAIPHLKIAGQRAASVFANEQAISLFNQARDILNGHNDHASSPDMAQVLEELGDVHERTGDSLSGLPIYEAGMAIYHGLNDYQGAFRLRGKAALSAISAGEAEKGSEHLAGMLDAMTEESPDLAVAMTYNLLAQFQWQSAKHQEALEAAEKALLAAHSSGDDEETAKVYEVLALACHSLGDWQKGIEYYMSHNELGGGGFAMDTAFDSHL